MSDLLPARAPRQLRSARTLERLVRASREILEESGARGLTVQAVVQRAGSSVGSFYARFRGKEELLAYLGERLWGEAAARWEKAVQSRALRTSSLAEVAEGVVQLLDDLARVWAVGTAGAGGPESATLAAFQMRVLTDLESRLLKCRGEITHPDPELAARLGLRAALAILEGATENELSRAIPGERRRQEAVSLLLSYLGGTPPGRGPSGRVDFFDIWG